MASEAELIVRTLDTHLTAPADIRLFGGAALVLGYGRSRATEDVDVLLDDAECEALIVSKLARADELDLADVRYLIERERLAPEEVRAAVARAVVPDVLREAFAVSRPRLDALLPPSGPD